MKRNGPWAAATVIIAAISLMSVIRVRSEDAAGNYRDLGMEVAPPGGIPVGQPFIDKYGQLIQGDWPGKVHEDGELRSRAAHERAQFQAAPGRQDRDLWGGWNRGPVLASTGFFHAAKYGNKWWLVDPDGRLFFSIGIDAMDDSDAAVVTITEGRSSYFAELPQSSDPLSAHFCEAPSDKGSSKALSFNFYNANLDRKFGSDWKSSWVKESAQRMGDWGFNTVGVWSFGFVDEDKTEPYVVAIGTSGEYNKINTDARRWGPMPDVFDPQYISALQKHIQEKTSGRQNDPRLLGYFVDNELSWWGTGTNAEYGIPIGILAQDAASSPAKSAFVSWLTASYGTIAKLNTSWNTNFGAWSALDAPYSVPSDPTHGQAEDLSSFLTFYAEKYFSTVKTQLRAADANHLYLGCRFARDAPPEVLRAAAKYCDVLSLNSYASQKDGKGWPAISNFDKPCIISEFGAGATDRGMFSAGQVDVGSQANRGVYYATYLRAAARSTDLVGCHWFDYVDEPASGRSFDGENGNFGLVDVTDTPYPELTSAAAAVNSTIYDLRSAK